MTYKAPGPPTPRRMGIWVGGGLQPSSFVPSYAAVVGFPIGATPQENAASGNGPVAFSRAGAEGTIPIIFNPLSNPTPFTPPGTLANLFKGGCRIFDTLNTSSNPVPAAPGGYNA